MKKSNVADIFSKAPVFQAVFKNTLLAMTAMLMILIYNLVDTFFIGQTHDALQVAAVSLATPVLLTLMAVGAISGIGGTSVIFRAMGEGRHGYVRSVCVFCVWSCVAVGTVMTALSLIYESDTGMDGRQRGYLGTC